jgi:hypothetical protein
VYLGAAAAAAVVRLVAVGAPVALDLAGVHVNDRDTLVAVSVGNVRLVVLVVERDLRHHVEAIHGVAVGTEALVS